MLKIDDFISSKSYFDGTLFDRLKNEIETKSIMLSGNPMLIKSDVMRYELLESCVIGLLKNKIKRYPPKNNYKHAHKVIIKVVNNTFASLLNEMVTYEYVTLTQTESDLVSTFVEFELTKNYKSVSPKLMSVILSYLMSYVDLINDDPEEHKKNVNKYYFTVSDTDNSVSIFFLDIDIVSKVTESVETIFNMSGLETILGRVGYG